MHKDLFDSTDEPTPDLHTPQESSDAIDAGDGSQHFVRNIEKQSKRLSLAEQKELFRRYYKDNDLAARNQIIVAHTKFAMTQIYGLGGFGLPLETLKAEAIAGLFVAVDRFNPDKGVKFITHCARAVRSHVQSVILEHNGIPKSDWAECIFFTLAAEKNRIYQENPNISDRDLVNRLCADYSKRLKYNITPRHIQFIDDRLASIHFSANLKLGDEDEAPELIDLVASTDETPEDTVEKAQDFSLNRVFLYHVMDDMTVLERRLIETLYLQDENRDVEEAAKIIGMSPFVARNLHPRLIEKFKDAAGKIDFKTFDYKNFNGPIPLPDTYLPTDTHKAVDYAAQKRLTSRDYFIFASTHLSMPGQKISLSDLAEGMNMPVPDLKAHLEKITDVVLKDLSKADIDSDFVREIKNNLSQSEGRTIPGTHFNETLVDLSSPDHAAIYQKAWEILKEKPLDLYIFLAGCLYIDAHRKTMPALGAEMGFSQQAAHKRLKSAKEALKSALPQLAHSPIFEKTAQIQRATRSQKFYAEAIPTVDEDKIDLSTEEHRIVFNAAKLLNPAQCYYLCMHALARDEHRQTYKEIAACVSVSEESVREAVARARDSIRSLLPEHYKDTRLIFQGPETSGRRSGVTALNIPRINKDLIDYSPDDVPAVLETATRFLTDYQLFIFVNHRMLVEKERMTTREIATAILNENPSVNADLNTVTHRVVASLSEINRKMQKFLPQDLKNTPILRQTPTHDRQSNSKIKCKVPELNRRFLELTTHEHRVLLPQIEKNLNPLQFYILASHRLLREHQRMTLPEIAEKCGRTVEDVRKILWDADKRLAKHLPEDLRNSPILRQKLVNPHKTQPDHMHPS